MLTGDDGSATITDLGDGTALLTISAPGYQAASQVVKATADLVATVEVRLQPLPGSVTGTIVDTVSGQGIADAAIRLGQWHAQTDANGRYHLADLTPGAYTLCASAVGYAPYEAGVMIGPGGAITANIALTRGTTTVVVRVVDAATGGAIAGATVGYGVPGNEPAAGGTGADLPCADVALLMPLKRSAAFARIRKRVADHHHLDSWQEDGLHFFVFGLHLAAGGAAGAGAPVAVFALHPAAAGPVSAVVVTPGPGGAEAVVRDLLGTDSAYTMPTDTP